MTRLLYDVENRKKIVREMYLEGRTELEIADRIGYKSTKHVKATIRKLGLRVDCPIIDVPKVLALRKAGWQTEQIIEEFGYKFSADQIEEEVKKYARRK